MLDKLIRCLVALALVLVSSSARAESPTSIIKRSYDLMRGKTSRVEMTLTVVKPSWTRALTMKTWKKGDDLTLLLITAPARDRGTSFLERNDEMWNWVPAIDRIIKLPASMMLQSWMGSDFTNEDMVRETTLVDSYTHRALGEESVGGDPCYKIEALPKPDAPAVWGKVIFWISKQGVYQRRLTYHDEDGKLVKTLNLYRVQKVGDRTIPTVLEMVPANKPGQKTVLEYKRVVFDEPIEDSYFSQQTLKKLH